MCHGFSLVRSSWPQRTQRPSCSFHNHATRLLPSELPSSCLDNRNSGLFGARLPRLSAAAGQIPDDLADALMIEDDGHATRGGEEGYPVPLEDCVRVIDLISTPAHRHDHEGPEWGPLLERPDRSCKCFSVHCPSPVL